MEGTPSLEKARAKRAHKRAIIHVDMDAFFAAIEQKRHPEYRGKPVVVGGSGDPGKRGVVSTASYEARRFGIRSAMPMREAFRRCPNAIFLPVDYSTYRVISRKFKAILREYPPLVESVGLDEAFMEVTQSPRGSPEQIAREIKGRIKREIGLTASVGVGPNKLLAKIASDLNKPDGLTVIREKNVAKTLGKLPTSKLWGVGRKTEKRLWELGIETIGQLATALSEDLIAHFGEKWGRALHEHARGMDESPIVPFHEPKSLGRELTYQRDTGDLDAIKKTFFRLVEETVGEMNRRGYRARTVALKLRTRDFTTNTRAHTLKEPTASLDTIWQTALRILSGYSIEKKLRLIGIRISNLEKVPKASRNS